MLTRILVPSLTNQLNALRAWLDKGAAHASALGRDPDALLAERLAPDMWPLAAQVRIAAFQAMEQVHRLRGEDAPDHVMAVRDEGIHAGERPGTIAEAQARIDEALALLATVGPDEFDAAADRPLVHTLAMGMVFDMTGLTYVRDWAIPQVSFHVMTAYALLRRAGVPLGKEDFAAPMFAYLRREEAAALRTADA